ncbi:MAG: dihydroorotate dehydrogenase [Candidatus Thorarchaeota archaeon]
MPRKTSLRSNHLLKVKIGSIELSNPLILASGILGVTAGGLIRAWQDGAAAVVTKSMGLQPRTGHPGPRIVGIHGNSLMNAMGLPNPGIADYLPEISTTLKKGIPVVASVFGKTPEEFALLTERLVQLNIAAIELNVSCPHADSLYLLGMDPNSVSQVVHKVVDHIDARVPVWVKLPGSTDYPRLIQVAQAAEAAKASAVVAINTLPALAIDAESQRPLLGSGIGGLSGPAIKPIALRAVWELYHAGISIPIIGAGGILSGNDVIEYILAGASAVQIGTGVLIRGTTIFSMICQELRNYLESHHVGRISDLTGQAKETDVNS